jgi:hypothetical protein
MDPILELSAAPHLPVSLRTRLMTMSGEAARSAGADQCDPVVFAEYSDSERAGSFQF